MHWQLLDGDALIEKFNEKADMAECLVDARTAERFATFCALADAVEEMQIVDAVPVVHGRWIEYPRAHYFKCSNCKYTVPHRKANLVNGKREYNYCPHCGAKMDWEEQNNA